MANTVTASVSAPRGDAEIGQFLHENAFVAGAWCAADDGSTLPVYDPATEAQIGNVPSLGVTETRRAIAAASQSLPGWKSRLPQERADILRTWYELIVENREALAKLMTLEQGKPLDEARGEIDYAASFVRWFSEEACRTYGETIPSHLSGSKLMVQREPIGVVATITPWNFPSGMLTRKAAAALAAGCTVVAVVSAETPYSALALADLAEQAGLPAGTFSVLTGEPQIIVPELCSAPEVRALSFTGSTEVGRLLLAAGATTVKKMSMELGGHAPFIVFPDADIEVAAAAAISAKFQTSGQDCLAANRIYVHEQIYDEFVDAFAAAARTLKLGNGFEPGVDIGPLIDTNAVSKCQRHVNDAVKKGAQLVIDGTQTDLGPRFFAPTVLTDISEDMLIFTEETFGPVAGITRFSDEAQVVTSANNTEYGLIAYVYTRDNSRALRLGDALEYGMVAVNTAKITGPSIPFGGIKQSGLGREGARQGIDEFTELKYICMAT